jgi:hypothetical protein
VADSAPSPETLRDLVAALKHDLAKYVAWQSANYDEAAWTGPLGDDLLRSLGADILRTKGEQPAWSVWDDFVVAVGRDSGLTELDAVRDAVDVLREVGSALRSEDREAVARARPAIRRAQQTIRSELRDLHRRLLRES